MTAAGGPAAFQAPGARRCRACSAEVPAGATRCPTCNAAQGELPPCPHCRATAGVAPHAEFRYVCDVCGGPRVPLLDPTIRFSGRENAALRKADSARKSRAGWRGGAVFSGIGLGVGFLIVSVLALIFGLSFKLLFLCAFLLGPFIGALIMAIGRISGASREIVPAIDAAWISAATDVTRQTRGGANAQVLAQKLGIEEPQAEELVALLDVNDVVGSPQLRFADAPAPVASAPIAPVPPGLTEVAAAEEEAAIAEAAGQAGSTEVPRTRAGKP